MNKKPKVGIISSNFSEWKNLGDFDYESRSIYTALTKAIGKENVYIIDPKRVRIYSQQRQIHVDYLYTREGDYVSLFKDLDAIIIRKTRGFVEGIKSIVNTLNTLCPNMKFFDPPEVYQNPLSKFDSFLKRQIAGIPQPQTIFIFATDDLKRLDLPKGLKFPVIVKPLKGHLGKCVKKCYTEQEAVDFIKNKLGNCDEEIIGGGIIIQQYIEVEKEFRIIVINGRSIGCRLKLSEDEIKNAYRGAEYVKVEDKEAEKLAEKAAQVQNIFFAGVDIVRDKYGNYYLLECNRSPGFLAFDLSKDENEKDVATIFVEEFLSSLQRKEIEKIDYQDEYDVFLCYSHSVSPLIEELHRNLVDVGLKPWLDKEQLVGVGNELENLYKDIGNSKLKVIIFSQKTVEKEKSYRKTFNKNKTINQLTEIKYILNNHLESTMCFLYMVSRNDVLELFPQLEGFVLNEINEKSIKEATEKIKRAFKKITEKQIL